MIEIKVHPNPKDRLSDWKVDYPEYYKVLYNAVEDMVEVAMNYGNPDGDKKQLTLNLLRCIDTGVMSFGFNEYGSLTLLTWNYTKGAYLPLDPKYFTQAETTWAMSMAQTMLNVN